MMMMMDRPVAVTVAVRVGCKLVACRESVFGAQFDILIGWHKMRIEVYYHTVFPFFLGIYCCSLDSLNTSECGVREIAPVRVGCTCQLICMP